jgi:Mig-14
LRECANSRESLDLSRSDSPRASPLPNGAQNLYSARNQAETHTGETSAQIAGLSASFSRFISESFLQEDSWRTISADEYKAIFERFGGSFVVHPNVVAVIATLSKRPVRYVGLTREGQFIAAVPLWGRYIAATTLAISKYSSFNLMDVGDSEVILPVIEDQLTNIPFEARMISSVHANNIANLERDVGRRDPSGSMMIAKSLEKLSGDAKRERRRETRRFLALGGRFHPISDLTVDETLEIYTTLYKKRWGAEVRVDGFEGLSVVFFELKQMMRGDILFINDRPVAMELLYAHETPRWLFVNGVKRVSDPEFWSYSVGSILTFRNLEQLENEARVRNKKLRHCFGWNDTSYKAQWAVPEPAYRLRSSQYSPSGDQTRDNNGYIAPAHTEWRFTELDFSKIDTLEACVRRAQDALASLEGTSKELAEVSTQSSKTIEYLKECVVDVQKKLDRAELNRQYLERRSVLEHIFFLSDGRPIKPLHRLLFHASGQPRGMFRRLVLHKDGTPRGLFSHWMQNRASVLSDLDRKFHRNI